MAAGKKTGGRQKGSLNKVTADVKILAGNHTDAAIKKLAKLIDSLDESISLAAIKEMLDRGHGRPAQSHQLMGNNGGAIVIELLGGDMNPDDV